MYVCMMTECKYCRNEVDMVDIQPTVDIIGRQYLKGICPRCNRVNLLSKTPIESLTDVSVGVSVNEPENTPIDTPIHTDIDTHNPDVSMNDDTADIDTPIDTDIDTSTHTYTEEENPQNDDTPIPTEEGDTEDNPGESEEGDTDEEEKGISPIAILVAVMILAVVVSLFLAHSSR